MTIKEAADHALMVQDACNLSAVAHTFSDVLSHALWPEAHRLGKGTEWVNQHPITTLFISKLADLNRYYPGYPGFDQFANAYDAVEAMLNSDQEDQCSK